LVIIMSQVQKGSSDIYDVVLFVHAILFAYQRAVRRMLGTGASIFIHPTLDLIRQIDEKRRLGLLKGKDLDDALANLTSLLLSTGVAKRVYVRKLSRYRIELIVDDCVFAQHVHPFLEPRDVTCPCAVIAMAIFEKYTGLRVKLADSYFTPRGSKTIIEALTRSST